MSDERWEFLQTFQLDLKGDAEGAIKELISSYQQCGGSAKIAVRLINAYIEAGNLPAADELAVDALLRWPDNGPILTGIAELRERQGRIEEALLLVEDSHVDRSADFPDYPLYLRLLIEARRYEDAAREAQRGLSSLWDQQALLTITLAQIALGNYVRAAEFLTKIDMQYATMLFTAWMRSVYGAGVLGDVQRILAIGETRIGKSETLRRMRELAEKAATAPDR